MKGTRSTQDEFDELGKAWDDLVRSIMEYVATPLGRLSEAVDKFARKYCGEVPKWMARFNAWDVLWICAMAWYLVNVVVLILKTWGV